MKQNLYNAMVSVGQVDSKRARLVFLTVTLLLLVIAGGAPESSGCTMGC